MGWDDRLLYNYGCDHCGVVADSEPALREAHLPSCPTVRTPMPGPDHETNSEQEVPDA